ncbi:MAG TPA: MazG family protein, partial [Chloroflexota bacterium]|nr:MazG family protein [Chloroflexota bacterium]
MGDLVVAGLGPGGVGQLTAEGRDLLGGALAEGRLLLRTRIHPTVEGWPALGGAPSLDHLYEQGADFGAIYERIAGAVLEAAQALPEGAELVYAVPGHPALGEATVPRLRTLARAGGTALRLVPGLSFVDAVAAVLEEDLGEGLRVADALALGRLDPTVPLLVCQVYSRRVASGVKLALGKHYPDEHPVVLVQAAGVPGKERVSRRALYEIDRDDLADHLTSLWVPPLAPLEALREPQTLQEVMSRLRAPDGCPWDREQTHASLRKYLLEETYETLEALDAGDVAALEEELGDLLLQIVFHAQVADEAGEFDLGDVVAGIVAKLIRRHPHVFGDEATGGGVGGQDAQAVLRNWEALKRAERAQKGDTGGVGGAEDTGQGDEGGGRSMLDGVPRAMPALAYAQAVQERVARVGF